MNFTLQSQPGAAPTPAPLEADLKDLRHPTQGTGPPKKRRGRKRAVLFGTVVVLVGVAVAMGLPGRYGLLSGLVASSAPVVVLFEVKLGRLLITVVEKGSIESSKNEDVASEVEGQPTIIMILPEGTRVTKGQLVCELDSASLKDQLTTQRITTEQADASYAQAKLTREVAEVAIIEYVEGTYKQDFATVRGEISLAESEKLRAIDRLTWTEAMFLKKYVSKSQVKAETLTVQKANFNLEQAQTKKSVLEQYTKEKTIKELKADVEKATSDELSKKATLELEKEKEAKYIKQIEKCKLFAPGDGLVVYANDPNRMGGSNAPQIEEGAAVRERQKIFSLPDITHMRVNTKVHESMVDKITIDKRARIRVDAFPGDDLQGSVVSVAPLPDPNSFFSSDIKVYTTLVAIENGSPGLRPGMTAEVTILIEELEDKLSVPVQGILEFKGKDYVYVRAGDGFERREVELGLSNDKLVEVKKGIKAGEMVVLSPVTLLTDAERREAYDTNKQVAKKDWGTAAKKDGGAPVGPGQGDPAAKGEGGEGKAKGEAKAKRKRGGAGGGAFNPAMMEKMKNASPEEQRKMLEDSGVPADRIDMILERIKSGGGGGGGWGGAGGGGRPGGPGGGGPGGSGGEGR